MTTHINLAYPLPSGHVRLAIESSTNLSADQIASIGRLADVVEQWARLNTCAAREVADNG